MTYKKSNSVQRMSEKLMELNAESQAKFKRNSREELQKSTREKLKLSLGIITIPTGIIVAIAGWWVWNTPSHTLNELDAESIANGSCAVVDCEGKNVVWTLGKFNRVGATSVSISPLRKGRSIEIEFSNELTFQQQDQLNNGYSMKMAGFVEDGWFTTYIEKAVIIELIPPTAERTKEIAWDRIRKKSASACVETAIRGGYDVPWARGGDLWNFMNLDGADMIGLVPFRKSNILTGQTYVTTIVCRYNNGRVALGTS